MPEIKRIPLIVLNYDNYYSKIMMSCHAVIQLKSEMMQQHCSCNRIWVTDADNGWCF